MLTCFCCKRFYNLNERKPILLPCSDVFCQQCYNIQKDQVQNQQIQCPFDAGHLCPIDQPIMQPLFLIRNLENYRFYLIKCDEHPGEESDFYCRHQNKFLCHKCLLQDPHQHLVADPSTHFDFDQKFLNESFQQMYSAIDDQIKQNLRDKNAYVQNYVFNFSQYFSFNSYFRPTFRQINYHIQEQKAKNAKLEADTINKIPEQDIEKYLQFRRLVDLQILNNENKPAHLKSLFKIKGNTRLLYKATRDKFKAASFHEKCDNQGPTVSFILSEHGQVFGGYTSLSWSSPLNDERNIDSDAFIFSLSKNTIHQQYQHFDSAVCHKSERLMLFGQGCDIRIYDNCNNNSKSYCNLGYTYMPPYGFKKGDQQCQNYLAGSYEFKVVEIEVYQVTL
ncbi:tldc domain-containing protein [Stylonychia lemnae]|uniref:Tldc domain-containing protein n=1 Tax=Stylonychia lemnae TaxID=5949 RepID=A0A077ZT84_STYLE|nr:tldc domain-containing protein [Stylonychia lemnae]|eukprot:CDW73093.1 tldc domain-containing protein [Stylonychia lemnae]